MTKKIVAFRCEEDIADKFDDLCQREGFVKAKLIQNMMRDKLIEAGVLQEGDK